MNAPLKPFVFVLVQLAAASCVAGPTPGTSQPIPTDPNVAPSTMPSPSPLTPARAGTTAPSEGCPIPAGAPPLPAFASAEESLEGALGFLNAGGRPEALDAAGLLSQRGLGYLLADLDRDGLQEIALVLGANPSPWQPAAQLLILACHEGAYSPLAAFGPGQEFSAPWIFAARDFNGDGGTDLLLLRERCGAHDCAAKLELLSWQGSSFLNMLAGSTEDLPNPKIDILEPEGSDRFPRIAITSNGPSSVGAGPPRPRTRVWRWSQAQQLFSPGGDEWGPSPYRIHRLHDADRLLAEGAWALAEEAFQQAIRDDTLKSWLDEGTERPLQDAYARFRLVLLYLMEGNRPAAEQTAQELRQAHPIGDRGAPYADLAETLLEASIDHDLSESCAIVLAQAAEHEADLLDSLNPGYANRVYTLPDLCPTNGM